MPYASPPQRPNVAQIARQELLKRLGTQWPVGQWLPPVPILARVLGVGQVNAHRAVVALTREGYLLPRRGRGTRVLQAPGYGDREGSTSALIQPGQEQQSVPLVTRPVDIAIVRSRTTDPLVHRMVDAFLDASRSLNPHYSFVLLEPAVERIQLQSPVDVAVLFNTPQADDLSGVWPQANHVIRVASGMPGDPALLQEQYRADLVTVDQRLAGYLAGRCLRDAGCRQACFIGRKPPGHSRYDETSTLRLRGFEAAWGHKLTPEHLMYGRFYGSVTGKHAFDRWLRLSPRPDGIFAASDELALGWLTAAMMQGYKFGEDFHLVGVDGQERARRMSGVPLTTVEVPADAMGRQAARLLRQRLLEGETQPMRVVMSCNLFRGQTVRLPGSASKISSHSAQPPVQNTLSPSSHHSDSEPSRA